MFWCESSSQILTDWISETVCTICGCNFVTRRIDLRRKEWRKVQSVQNLSYFPLLGKIRDRPLSTLDISTPGPLQSHHFDPRTMSPSQDKSEPTVKQFASTGLNIKLVHKSQQEAIHGWKTKMLLIELLTRCKCNSLNFRYTFKLSYQTRFH